MASILVKKTPFGEETLRNTEFYALFRMDYLNFAYD